MKNLILGLVLGIMLSGLAAGLAQNNDYDTQHKILRNPSLDPLVLDQQKTNDLLREQNRLLGQQQKPCP